MNSARTILKTAAIGAALMTSTSAFAQWAGEWTINGTNTSLMQADDYVSGQMGRTGVIQGVLSPDKKILRGVFKRGNTRQTIELKLNRDEKFVGGIVSFNGGYPVASTRNIRWTGQLKRRSSPVGSNNSGQQSFLNEQSRRVQGWIRNVANMRGAATASVSRPTAVVQAPEADIYPIEGNWSVTVQGAEYGPLRARRMVLQFTNPDSNGLVVGRAPGKPLVMIGRRDGNSGFRGVWMETAGPTNFSTTGRWGVVQASSYRNANGSGMDARFSVGYRLPLKQVSNPAIPGMRARGSHLDGGTGGGWPSARVLLNAWDRMVAKPSPYSAIHGIWPTSEINTAIQKWVGNERVAGNFGTTQNVDFCAAKCMGNEPVAAVLRTTSIWANERREEKYEIAGQIDAGLVFEVRGKRTFAIPERVKRVFERGRDNPLKGGSRQFRLGLVEPPPPPSPAYQYYGCDFRRDAPSYSQVSFPIPSGIWSDPLTSIRFTYGGVLAELGVNGRNQDVFRPDPSQNNEFLNFKEQWNEVLKDNSTQAAISAGQFDDQKICLKSNMRFDGGKRWESAGAGTNVFLRTP